MTENRQMPKCPLCGQTYTKMTNNKEGDFFRCLECGQYVAMCDIGSVLKESRLSSFFNNRQFYNPIYRQFLTYLRNEIWWTCVNKFQSEKTLEGSLKDQYAIITEPILKHATINFKPINIAEQIDKLIFALALKEQGLFTGYAPTISIQEYNDINNNILNELALIGRLVGIDTPIVLNFRDDSQRICFTYGSSQGFLRLRDEMRRLQYISPPHKFDKSHDSLLSLTLEGWERYNELQSGKLASGPAFMAMEFSDANKWAYMNIFRPAAEACGFDLQTVDKEPKAGSIRAEIELKIKRAPFVVADVSGGNNGAYWEAGFALGLGKEVIYTCDTCTWESESKKIRRHFDIIGDQTIQWEKKENESAHDINIDAFKIFMSVLRNSVSGATFSAKEPELEVKALLNGRKLVYSPKSQGAAERSELHR